MPVAAPSAMQVPSYIDGQWRDSSPTEFLDVANPATGEVVAQTPRSDTAEVNAAIEAAAAAYPEWRRAPPEDRIEALFKLKQLLEDHVDELGRITGRENGKTFVEGKAGL